MIFDPEHRAAAVALAGLGTTNPFTRERVEHERAALGRHWVATGPVWVVDPQRQGNNPNLPRLAARAEQLVARARARLDAGVTPSAEDWALYEELALYTLYYRYEQDFFALLNETAGPHTTPASFPRFQHDLTALLAGTPLADRPHNQPAHVFALFFQLRRAFHFIFRAILGTSTATSELRKTVWQAIFSHDTQRYRRALYRRMQEISTLVLGPSGTGKELVASAIGWARYIPFDARRQRFDVDFRDCIQAVHLAALPTTTLESELFGHRKGAFTGAIADRAGYLETQHDAQSVFLDEIGELPAEVQVKLLRVLQTREFHRLGDNAPRQFHGKILSATHRDLAVEMRAGRFREDLYYRLCSDVIRTPSLKEQLEDDPEELYRLVQQVAARIVDTELAIEVTADARRWLSRHLPEHDWPGNMRELEQCVRSIVIRGRYEPATTGGDTTALARFNADIMAGRLDHDQLIGRYYALVYAQSGSFEAAARRLGTDRRTVKARLDNSFLTQLGK